MSATVCISCRKPQTITQCGLCQEPLCKSCKVDLRSDRLTLLTDPPANLSHKEYCPYCYGENIEPSLHSYDEIAMRAKGLFVFYTTQKAWIPLLHKSKELLKIQNCEDKELALLQLAYQAASRDFNALMEVELKSVSIRDTHGYRKTSWSAQGFPAKVDAEKLEREPKLK